jgi:hypothetical protein
MPKLNTTPGNRQWSTAKHIDGPILIVYCAVETISRLDLRLLSGRARSPAGLGARKGLVEDLPAQNVNSGHSGLSVVPVSGCGRPPPGVLGQQIGTEQHHSWVRQLQLSGNAPHQKLIRERQLQPVEQLSEQPAGVPADRPAWTRLVLVHQSQ